MHEEPCSFKSFMNTKKLNQHEAQEAEKLGCVNYEIKFQPEWWSTKPGELSHQPDFPLTKEDRLILQYMLRPKNIIPETLLEISSGGYWFKDGAFHLENFKHCFNIQIIGINNPAD